MNMNNFHEIPSGKFLISCDDEYVISKDLNNHHIYYSIVENKFLRIDSNAIDDIFIGCRHYYMRHKKIC